MPKDERTANDSRACHGTTTNRVDATLHFDRELLERIKTGDEQAIAQFITTHRPLLSAIARRWPTVADAEAIADEVLEDIALRVIDGQFWPHSSISAYAAKVFRVRLSREAQLAADIELFEGYDRTTINANGHVRSLTAAVVARQESEAELTLDVGVANASIEVRLLAEAIERALDIDERSLLQYVNDFWTHREISEELGISLAACSQRISRLRRRLTCVAVRYAVSQPGRNGVALRRWLSRAMALSSHNEAT